jgi:diguanylate cyclase (GGDEF)-like protein
MKFPASLEKRSKPFWIIVGLILAAEIGILDFLSGHELAFSLFYLFPISLVTWFTNRRTAIVLAIMCAWVWFVADVAAGSSYSHYFIYIWNTLICLSFFMVTVLLLSALKRALAREKLLTLIDHLTGAVNSGRFYDLVQVEIDRFQRHKHPFTLIYIDIDNFKAVNEKLGYPIGDQVLCAIVRYAQKHLRKIDVIARLDGDKFGLLLTKTSQGSACIVLAKFQCGLLQEMKRNNWPVTFSIGVVTCNTSPSKTNELMTMVDELMYSVKRGSKNAVKYASYTG